MAIVFLQELETGQQVDTFTFRLPVPPCALALCRAGLVSGKVGGWVIPFLSCSLASRSYLLPLPKNNGFMSLVIIIIFILVLDIWGFEFWWEVLGGEGHWDVEDIR